MQRNELLEFWKKRGDRFNKGTKAARGKEKTGTEKEKRREDESTSSRLLEELVEESRRERNETEK